MTTTEEKHTHFSISICADENTMASILNRIQPWQQSFVKTPKCSANSGVKKADNASPWRHIGELGEIAYMEDGTRRWTLKAGWEEMRIFLVYLSNGERETHFAYIDDRGALCDHSGDDLGWMWCDADYYMDIPDRPILPDNSK